MNGSCNNEQIDEIGICFALSVSSLTEILVENSLFYRLIIN